MSTGIYLFLLSYITLPLLFTNWLLYINFSGEKESRATSNNNNASRFLGKRKLHGTRVDLRFVYDGAELGCAEAGRSDEGELGTKEMNESCLKCPKTLRDMYVLLLKKYPDKQNQIMTFGFILMGKYNRQTINIFF